VWGAMLEEPSSSLLLAVAPCTILDRSLIIIVDATKM
jgi:hypothetical protein